MPTNRDSRLNGELLKMQRLVEHSSFISFEAYTRADDLARKYPEEYTVTFTCKALVEDPGQQSLLMGRIPDHCIGEEHVARIHLSPEYPDVPPKVRFETPIFHPNIFSVKRLETEKAKILENISLEQLQHEDPDTAWVLSGLPICLDGLKTPNDGGTFRPKLSLYDICVEIARMIMYQNYRLFDDQGRPDVFNGEALVWAASAEKRPGMLPIDGREILDKRQRHLREEPADINITILDIEADQS